MHGVVGYGFLGFLLSALSGSAVAADTPRTPYQIVTQLGDKMYTTGETSGSVQNFQAVIEQARQEIQDYAAAGGDPAAFVEKGPHGTTPLLIAATEGYADIVVELLKNKRVAASVNDVDEYGFSAWTYANFAWDMAVWVCNPNTLNDPHKFVPKWVEQAYYIGGAEHPYQKTRRVLEAAGAKTDMAATKQFWLDTCKLATPENRQKVTESRDLLATLETEGTQILAVRMQPKR
jgi:hypothetical protein